jgi:hypothetical protein
VNNIAETGSPTYLFFGKWTCRIGAPLSRQDTSGVPISRLDAQYLYRLT